jgi:type IV secretory pathway VirB2 component (pilin)
MYPYDPACTITPITPPCVATNSCATPYRVNNTTKTTTIGNVLCQAVYYVKSNIARGLATLAIFILAICAIYGKLTWKQTIACGVGIAAVFGAAELAYYIGTSVAGFETTLACLVPV